jgi:hypothetical protein
MPKNKKESRLVDKFKKPILVLLTLALLSPTFLIVSAQPAKAAAMEIGLDIPRGIEYAVKEGYKEIEKAFRLAIAKSMMMFSRTIASQLAVKLARQTKGVKGGSLDWRDMNQIVQDAAYNAMGEAIGTISEEFFGDAAFLCNPNPYIRLVISLSMFNAAEPTPICDGRAVIENYQNLAEEWNSGEFLKRFSMSFKPKQSDIGSFTEAMAKIDEHKAEAVQARVLDKLWGAPNQWFDVSDKISGYRNSSRDQIATFVNATMIQNPSGESQWTALYSLLSGSILTPFIFQFADSFVAEMMKVWLMGLFGDYTLCDANIPGLPKCDQDLDWKGGGGEWGSGMGSEYSESQAQETFASLLTMKIAAGGEYDILSEFAACPDPAGINNCVIDSAFHQAIMNHMTVQEAMDQGLLNPNWPLGYINPATGVEPKYDEGYGMANLRKLRKARIISVGWELAAEKIQKDKTAMTLKQVVEQFNQTDSSNRCGTGSAPFCGLIDPDWVLKAPQQKCYATTSSPMLIESGQRQDWCADSKSCTLEAQDGSCKAWGYCTREKNIWWFGGKECPSNYVTCQKFIRKVDNKSESFLKSSLIYLGCDANNKGCWWYSRYRNSDGDWTTGEEKFSSPPALPSDLTTKDLIKHRVFLDRDTKVCSAEVAGCSQFIRSYGGSGTNLVKNGSFENYYQYLGETGQHFYGWDDSGLVSADTDFYIGSSTTGYALQFGTSVAQITQTVPVGYELSERTFTLAFAVKNCPAPAKFKVDFGPLSKNLGDLLGPGETIDPNTYQGFSITYTYPINTAEDQIILKFVDTTIPSGGCLLDGVKVEESSAPSFYQEYGAINLAYFKKAPDYLNCTSATADQTECAKYAHACTAWDVGCQKYTALSDGTEVPGIIKPEDYCPAECNGYRTYKQEASNFYSNPSTLFPLYFIASTAQTCNYADAGCEQFTNLDTVAAGGEGRENYSFLRRCQKAGTVNHDCVAYYTWEGSEITGYQLKLYNLKADPDDNNIPLALNDPQHPAAPGEAYDCQAIYGKNPGEAGYDPVYTPDCKEFYSGSGQINYRLYSRTVSCSNDCHPYRLSDGRGIDTITYDTMMTVDDPPVGRAYDTANINNVTPNYDCEKSGGLYTQCINDSLTLTDCYSKGGAYYNGVCYNLKKKSDCGQPSDNFTWDILGAECRYLGTPQESQICGQPGCQIYKGNFAGDRYIVTDDSFEAGADEWSAAPAQLVGESYSVAGHSLTPTSMGSVTLPGVSHTFPKMTLARTLEDDTTDPSTFLLTRKNKAYILSFWAKSQTIDPNVLRIAFSGIYASSDTDIPRNYFNTTRSLSANWSYYRFGPVFVDWAEPDKYLVFSSDNLGVSRKFYIDNVRLEELSDTQFLIRNTWQTPQVCDQNHAGAAAPQYMLGCEAYQDSTNQIKYLKSFFRLCSDEVVGCEALIDTQNSTFPGHELYNSYCRLTSACTSPTGCPCQMTFDSGQSMNVCTVATNEDRCLYTFRYPFTTPIYNSNFMKDSLFRPDWTFVPEDNFIFLVANPEKACQAQDKGCTAMARPRLDEANKAKDYLEKDGGNENIKYLVNNPDAYDTSLCSMPGLGCEEYDGGGNLNPVYFHEPDMKVCTWQQKPGEPDYAWMKKGTNDLCPILAYLPGKEEYDGWQTWAEECPAEYSTCSLFVDPAGAAGNNLYYYLDNQLLDKTECSGLASQKKGCVLFENYNQINWAAEQKKNLDSGFESFLDSPNKDLALIHWQSPLTSNAKATYVKSEKADNQAVAPIDCTNAGTDQQFCNEVAPPDYPGDYKINTSNELLKVRRDRVCAEWLDCARSIKQFDKQSNEYKIVCLNNAPCSQFVDNSTFACAVQTPLGDGDGSECDPESYIYESVLDKAKYLKRSFNWDGYEYSGYSLPGVYPVWSLIERRYGKCIGSGALCYKDSTVAPLCNCKFSGEDFRVSHFDKDDKDKGINGSGSYANKDCRGYPEKDSPFPSVVAGLTEFEGSNICYDVGGGMYFGGNTKGCDCHYQKLEVKEGAVKTYIDDENSGIERICSAEDEENLGMSGQKCDDDQDCMICEHEPGYLAGEDQIYANSDDDSTTCYQKTPSKNDVCIKPSKTKLIGWRGYCLEYDKSIPLIGKESEHPCLSWMPIDLIKGEPDIFNNVPAAASALPDKKLFYCLGEKGNYPYQQHIMMTQGGLGVQWNPLSRQTKGGGCRDPLYPWLLKDTCHTSTTDPWLYGEVYSCGAEEAGYSDKWGCVSEIFDIDYQKNPDSEHYIYSNTLMVSTTSGGSEPEYYDQEYYKENGKTPPCKCHRPTDGGWCDAENWGYRMKCGARFKPKSTNRTINNKQIESLIFDEVGCFSGKACSGQDTVPLNIYRDISEANGRAVVFLAQEQDRGIYYNSDPPDDPEEYGYTKRSFPPSGGKSGKFYYHGYLGSEPPDCTAYSNAYLYLTNNSTKEEIWIYYTEISPATLDILRSASFDTIREQLFYFGPDIGGLGCFAIMAYFKGNGDLDQIVVAVAENEVEGEGVSTPDCQPGQPYFKGGIALLPTVVYQEWCTAVTQMVTDKIPGTSDPIKGNFYSAAWADRVWQDSVQDYKIGVLNYESGQYKEIYGSSKIDDLPPTGLPSANKYLYVQEYLDSDIDSDSSYYNAGSPYSCSGGYDYCDKKITIGESTDPYRKQIGVNSPGLMLTTITEAKNRLSGIFAMSFGDKVFSTSWSDSLDWDKRKTEALAADSYPVVKPAILNLDGTYKEDSEEGIVAVDMVKDPGPGNYYVASWGGQWQITLSFYASSIPYGEHLPLRKFLIDWDNDTEPLSFPEKYGDLTETSYPNYSDDCSGGHFGEDEGTGCQVSPIVVQNTYRCFGSGDPGWQPCSSLNLTIPGGGTYTGDCCVYQPKVLVVDNWGICAKKSYCPGGMCMLDVWNDEADTNECYNTAPLLSLEKYGSNTVYTGTTKDKIVIVPPGAVQGPGGSTCPPPAP